MSPTNHPLTASFKWRRVFVQGTPPNMVAVLLPFGFPLQPPDNGYPLGTGPSAEANTPLDSFPSEPASEPQSKPE